MQDQKRNELDALDERLKQLEQDCAELLALLELEKADLQTMADALAHIGKTAS